MYSNAKNVALKDSAAPQNTVAGTSARETQVGTARNDAFYATTGDTMIGGAGDDTYTVWDTNYTIVEKENEGVDTLISNAWGAITLAANVENLVLRGAGARSGTGNALDNILVASAAGSTLNGMAGDDVLVGGAKGDLFKVAAGNGSDTIVNFTSGSDAIQLQGYGVSSFRELMSLASQVGSDVRFSFANGETLVVRDTKISGLHDFDFGFHKSIAADPGETLMVGAGKAWTANGWYILNNVWNPGDLVQDKDYKIESTYNRANMTEDTTFSWTFPFTTEYGAPVRAYPEVFFGPTPKGGGGRASDVGGVFPLQVSSITNLIANFDVSISGNTSGFNVAFDLFLTSVPNGARDTLTNEVMIWLHEGDFPAFGTVVGHFSDGNFSGTIYNKGAYTAIVADKDVLVGSIDIAGILAKLVSMGIISPKEYLATVELGSEVFSGVGSLTIHNLDLDVTTAPANGVITTYHADATGTTTEQHNVAPPAVAVPSRPISDTINGTDGNDTLNGSAAEHKFNGGAGHDQVSYDKAAAGVVADLLTPSANTGDAAGDVYTSIEGLIGSAFNDVLSGDAAANTLWGGAGDDVLQGRDGDDILEGQDGNDTLDGGAGADILRGGNGDDVLQGGAGADVLDGGAGRDRASYESALAAVTVNLLNTSQNTGDAAGDTYVSIEDISGSAFNDTLSGDNQANVIWGNAGDDRINGRDGNDILNGGAGADSLYGDAGDDILNGGDGNDVLTGGAGADRLDGGEGVDWTNYQQAASGVTVDLQNAAANTGEAAGDTFVSIENIAGSAYNDILRGDAGANYIGGNGGDDIIQGRDGDDHLDGGDGNDLLYGDAGNDILRGGAGDDVLVGGAGADFMDGGAGIDRVSYENSLVGLTVSLSAPSVNTGDAVGDIYANIENLSGSAFADDLRGDAGANEIWGAAGNDIISGYAGNDVLWGGEGDDTLYGDAGDDKLYGGDGNDVLTGGAGADLLDGGAGIDQVRYNSALTGVIADLMAPAGNTGEAAGDRYVSIENLSGSNFNDILRGDRGDNVLLGNAGDDRLEGRDGNDILEGGAGTDYLDGGAGIDIAQYSGAKAAVVADLSNSKANTGDAAGDTFVSIEGVIGSMFNDILRGDAGDNYLFGGHGDDVLVGGDGNDTLQGGVGYDRLTGGAGADRFLFGAKDSADTITDFEHGIDRITLQRSAFGLDAISGAERALTSADVDFITGGAAATSGRPTLLWNARTGVLSFDADGNGSGKATVLATMPGATVTLSDIYSASDDAMSPVNLLTRADTVLSKIQGASVQIGENATSTSAQAMASHEISEAFAPAGGVYVTADHSAGASGLGGAQDSLSWLGNHAQDWSMTNSTWAHAA